MTRMFAAITEITLGELDTNVHDVTKWIQRLRSLPAKQVAVYDEVIDACIKRNSKLTQSAFTALTAEQRQQHVNEVEQTYGKWLQHLDEMFNQNDLPRKKVPQAVLDAAAKAVALAAAKDTRSGGKAAISSASKAKGDEAASESESSGGASNYSDDEGASGSGGSDDDSDEDKRKKKKDNRRKKQAKAKKKKAKKKGFPAPTVEVFRELLLKTFILPTMSYLDLAFKQINEPSTRDRVAPKSKAKRDFVQRFTLVARVGVLKSDEVRISLDKVNDRHTLRTQNTNSRC
jgi:hypothetical protein